MILTIDNLDGNGALDYTPAIATRNPLQVERQLNLPTICSFCLVSGIQDLITPLRFARVVLTDDNGAILFTGYVATDPALELAGEGLAGPAYKILVSATSDDVLLDMQGLSLKTISFAESAGQMLQTILTAVDPTLFTFSAAQSVGTVGRFVSDPGESWSKNVGSLSSSTRSSYKALAGNVSIAPIGSVTHSLSESDGSLQVSRLQASMIKMLANDVTVCGQEEPSAYVTEVFAGDGVTTLFDLTEIPFFPSTSKAQPLIDLFQEPAIDPWIWQILDPGSHLSLTGNGLTCTGGNGHDGQTALYGTNNLELGGSLIIEASGVTLSSGSQGILSGLYDGDISTQNCLAGFQVNQISGNTVVLPIVNTDVAGSTFSPVAGHVYTLRTRIYCKEMQRVLQSFYSTGDSGTQSWGGTIVPAAVHLSLEVQDMTDGVSQTPIVLYDGALTVAPPVCTYALINSTNLICSIRSVEIAQEGPVWVTSVLPNGTSITRRVGTTAQGADCRIERTGKIRFYATSLPQAGEQIFVSYRTKHRAVARKANSVSVTTQSSTTIPSSSRWLGTVTTPNAISSMDCENAANALLNLASSKAAAWKGSYTGWNFDTHGDIWPGDVLAITAANITANLVVRTVQIEMVCAVPQMLKYTIHFANDWADALAIKTTSSVPTDTWLPQQPQAVEPLDNLLTLTVSSVSTSAIQIGTGVTPPSGGGFEVRRRDWAFGPGTDSDLVLRSPVSSFSIPRQAAIEQFYIRTYDGSTPPNYSRFSNAVFINVPL